jgi:hypothetical protein
VAALLLAMSASFVLSLIPWSYMGCWGPPQGAPLNSPGVTPPSPPAVCATPQTPWFVFAAVIAITWIAFLLIAEAVRRLSGKFGLTTSMAIAFLIVLIFRAEDGEGGYACNPGYPCGNFVDWHRFILLAAIGVVCWLVSGAVVRLMTRHSGRGASNYYSRRVLAVFASAFAALIGVVGVAFIFSVIPQRFLYP